MAPSYDRFSRSATFPFIRRHVMLKALELYGFKSFADKTRFEFPAGITVVVGPNGSGKSNIVDGIKWVLGEQSAKSLRGKEMSDVIFKGSGTGGRKPMNAAEATLVFDNSGRHLPIDAPEVHITRRVYRSGEGEYLINRQPARMKDIRDMFRGTGVGVDAYSMIEQGKVDKLLQASAKDRRAIFEEAAGISRFKAKKVEAQRRLERVDQNLLRLSDIVEEVESRLRSVRNQASKAKRYREYSQRLQQLRTHVAQHDWRQLSEQLAALEAEAEAHRNQAAESLAHAESLEAQLLELDTAMTTAGEEIRNAETRLARNRHDIAQREAASEHEASRCHELDEQATQLRRNLVVLSDRAGDLKTRIQQTQEELIAAEKVHGEFQTQLADHEQRLAECSKEHQQLRQQGEERRRDYVARMQTAAVLASQLEAHLSQLAALEQQRAAYQHQLSELETAAESLATELATSQQQEQQASEQATALHSEVEASQNELSQQRMLYASRQEDLAQLNGRRRGVAERAAVLEELERNLEGLGTGVKDLMARARETSTGPLTHIRGVVADLVQAPVELGLAIDAALGEAAQYILVDQNVAELGPIAEIAAKLAGRVTFFTAGVPEFEAHPSPSEPRDEAILGRADTLVQFDASHAATIGRLLGNTWIVRTLGDAIRLQNTLPSGSRVVTLAGEVLESQGTLAVGPRQAATNLVSRRSQLRALKQELSIVDLQISGAQHETTHLKKEIERREERLEELTNSLKELRDTLAERKVQTRTLEERARQNEQKRSALQTALGETQQRCAALQTSVDGCQRQLAATEAEVATLRDLMKAEESKIAELDQRRQQATREVTAARVELAKSEQRLEALRIRRTQLEEDQRDRERSLQQAREQITQSLRRRETAELAILSATAEIALLYLEKEKTAREAAEHIAARDAATSQRNKVVSSLNNLRKTIRQLEENVHQVELSAGTVRHERTTLAERMREDYGIDLNALSQSPDEEGQQREAIEEEIETLRRKINQIGAVNLDALEELDDLESRFGSLSAQHRDLTDAKQALERIIHKINADSRRLFLETLEAIRVNFQALYRKAFGGGKADIVLEEGVDVLECGVEIIATPPGKPSFNNSLLSGGEKALTAVALLLAIFQFRPSPFCILDEVDAPFDEANIGRFVDVLKDFLGWTKFVIVTHSKKTMTAATTLYGVTMQESGVSKRVSVRFDDVTDDGHIRREALDREEPDESDTSQDAA